MLGLPAHFFGWMATSSSLVLIFVGIPKQILDNYRAKKFEGSKVMQLALIFGYFSWMLYGISKWDMFVAGCNTLAFALGLILCFQMVIYRNAK